MKIVQALKVLDSLHGLISVTKYVGVMEVHMTMAGLRALHTEYRGKVTKEVKKHLENPYRYRFTIGDAVFFAMSERESGYFETVIEHQESDF